MKVGELLNLGLPYIYWNESISKGTLEFLPLSRTHIITSICHPLVIPYLVHAFELMGHKVGLLIWRHPHNCLNFIGLINKLLRFLIHFIIIKFRWIYPYEIPDHSRETAWLAIAWANIVMTFQNSTWVATSSWEAWGTWRAWPSFGSTSLRAGALLGRCYLKWN